MRIPPHPSFRTGARPHNQAGHSEAIEQISRVDQASFRKQKQSDEQIFTDSASALPAVIEPATSRRTGFGRWQHSVPFLAQFIAQTHWSRPRRAAMPAPQDASGAYSQTDQPDPATGTKAFHPRISRII